MSLKILALIIIVVGVTLLVAFLLYEKRKRDKEQVGGLSVGQVKKNVPVAHSVRKEPSIHDYFDNQDAITYPEEDQKVIDTSPTPTSPINPYSGYLARKYLINRQQNTIYDRLENLLSGDFRISPKIRMTDIIKPEKQIIENDAERARTMNNNFHNARFDFVITNLDDGAIRGVVMTERSIGLLQDSSFITELLKKLKIPMYLYGDDDNHTDDQLSNLLYETFEDASNDDK